MFKKLILIVVVLLFTLAAFAQGTVPLRSFVSAGSSNSGISYSLGQTFNEHAPADAVVPAVAEGIQQGYTTVAYDTLLLLASEMGTYTPGDTTILGSTPEGYDETRYRRVYEMTCPSDYDTTMAVSGRPTCDINLSGTYAAAILPNDGFVTLTSSPTNPYAYPVGDTTVTTWTATVAGQTKECSQNVIVRYYNCALHADAVDADGNRYSPVNLGYYCWTNKNLRTYTGISNVMTYPHEYAPDIADSAAMVDAFGHLYTWNDAVGGTSQGICPDGWHIPTLAEAQYIRNQFEAIQLMSDDSQIHWLPVDGTDDYGFKFLPGGYYNPACNCYEGLFVQGYFWTTETPGSSEAISCMFGSMCGSTVWQPSTKTTGYSVRCVLDY